MAQEISSQTPHNQISPVLAGTRDTDLDGMTTGQATDTDTPHNARSASSQGSVRPESSGTGPERQRQNSPANQVQTTGAAPDKGWLSKKLQWPYALKLLFAQFGCVITLIVLQRVSAAQSGFQVSASSSVTPHLFSRALLWTALPSFLISLYQRIFWDPMLGSFMSRQPYVELRRPLGSTAKRTIMLDYASISTLTVWKDMFGNGHYLLSAIMFFSLISSLSMAPLTANIFQAASVLGSHSTSLQILSEFNSSLLSASVDFRTVLETVNALLIHGATFPEWTTATAALPQLAIDYSTHPTRLSNYTTNVSAWSADVECVAYSNETITFDDLGDATFDFQDRGCQIQQTLPISPYQQISVQLWQTMDCSETSGYTRMGFIASRVTVPQGGISDSILVSCIPRYMQQTGELRIEYQSIIFTPDVTQEAALDPHNSLFPDYPYLLALSDTFDSAADFSGKDFAKLIYDYASFTSENGQDAVAPSILLNATRAVFQSTFSVLVGTVLRQSISTVPLPSLTANETLARTRLFVYAPATYPVASLLLVSAVVTLTIALYSARHPSILHEENKGLISYAVLVKDSDMDHLIKDAARWSREDQNLSPEGENERAAQQDEDDIEMVGLPQSQADVPAPGADMPAQILEDKANSTGWHYKTVETLEARKTFEASDSEWTGNWGVESTGQGTNRICHRPGADNGFANV